VREDALGRLFRECAGLEEVVEDVALRALLLQDVRSEVRAFAGTHLALDVVGECVGDVFVVHFRHIRLDFEVAQFVLFELVSCLFENFSCEAFSLWTFYKLCCCLLSFS